MSMTTRQTPDAVREAYIIDIGAALRPSDRSVAMAAFDAGYAAALDSRAGDAGEWLAAVIAAGDLLYRHLDGAMTSSIDEAKRHWNQTSVRVAAAAATPMRDSLEPTTDDVRRAIHRLTVLAQKESDPPAITKAMIWAYLHGRTDVATPAPAVDARKGLTANSMDLVEGACTPIKALQPSYDPLNGYVIDNLPRWILEGWTGGNETYEGASEQMQEWANDAAKGVVAGIRQDMESLAPAVDAQEEAEHIRQTEMQEIADGAYGDGPATRGAARDYLAPAVDAVPAGEVETTQTFELRWTGAARPPVHPKTMSGRQQFTSFERAARFMLNQPSDAKFVSLHADVTRRYDRTADMRAALDADARLDASLSHGEGRK